MQTVNLETKRLHPSKINPRKGKGAAQSMDELVASIKSIGILQPPTVRQNGKGFDVLWGNRRVIAAKKAGIERIQCVLVEMDDKAARIAATAENVVRIGMDPMDQFDAFYAIHKDGETPASIATIFGVSEHLVNQRLRLAELDPMIRKAYREDKMDIGDCMAMTLGTHKQQRDLLKNNCTSAWMIKRELVKGKVPMSEAMFDPKLYTGGQVVDLFDSEDETAGYATDRSQFYDLQLGAINQLIKTEGKKWLFAVASEKQPHDLKEVAGYHVSRHYIHPENLKAKEKKKYGIIYHIDPDSCQVRITYGWQMVDPPKKKSEKTDKSGKTEKGGFTQNQQKILAQAHIDMHDQEANLNDALIFYLLHRVSQETKKTLRKADTKELYRLFIKDVTGYATKMWPDYDIKQTAKSNRWNIRKTWTPDKDFIQPFSQPQLEAIAKACDISLHGRKKKSEKVDAINKAFSTNAGKTKEWQPL